VFERVIPVTCKWSVGDIVRFYIGTISNIDEDIRMTNAYLEYNIPNQKWLVGSLGHSPTAVASYEDISATTTYDAADVAYDSNSINYDGFLPLCKKMYMGCTNSVVYELDNGYTDASTNIPLVAETADLYQSDPNIFKDYQRIVVKTKYGSSLTLSYRIDDGEWEQLGELQENHTEFDLSRDARGKKIRLLFTDIGSGYPVQLLGYTIYYVKSTLT
jgi:hypothetical protein